MKSITIAAVFNEHRDELFDLINKNKQQDVRNKVLELLEDERLKNNADRERAKNIFAHCCPNYNKFLSTLMTYITCMKVGS